MNKSSIPMETIENNAGNGKNKQSLIVNNITIRAINRSAVDIDKLRDALRAADRGRLQQLYNIYTDLLVDPILADAIDKLTTAITNAELTFTRNNKPEPRIDTLMDTPGFERVLVEIVLAHILGISVTEMEFTGDKVLPHPLPRTHLRPKFGEVAVNESDERGIPYRDDDFVLEVRGQDEFGVMLKVAPYVIYKRGNAGDWAQYVEIYGRPIRVVYYEAYDEGCRIEAEKAMQESGGNLGVVLPTGTTFDIKPGAQSGDGEINDKFRKACNEEILIGILGQTLTTVQGDKGARSLGEVHMEVQEGKFKAMRRFVQRVLNTQFLPMLEKRGFPVSGGYFYFPEQGETLSLAERWSIEREMMTRLPIGTQYIYDTYGVPRPAEDEETIYLPGGSNPQPESPPDDDGDDDPQQREGKVRNAVARVLGFFAGAPVQGAFRGNLPIQEINDRQEDDFDTRLVKRVARGEAAYFDTELFLYFAGQLIRALGKGFGDYTSVDIEPGIEYGVRIEGVRTAMETNLYHFSAAKTLAELQRLNQIFRESKDFRDYLQRAKSVTDTFNKAWAATEYNTAYLTAQSTATYHRLMKQVDLYPYWQRCTVGDDQVRPKHRLIDGVILAENDPLWQKIYPPDDWNCRCYVVPKMRHEVSGIDLAAMRRLVEEYLGSADFQKADAQGFGVNRATLGQVFTDNQQYIRKFPGKAAKYLDRIGASDFGLPSATKAQKEAAEAAPKYSGTADEWWIKNERDGRVELETYNGRTLILSQKSYNTHTSKSHNSRVQYLACIRDVVKNPDEIWINNERAGTSYNNYTIIKYYQDEILVVCCRLDRDNINQVRTWFPLRMKKETIEKHRRGLLIYTTKAPRNGGALV